MEKKTISISEESVYYPKDRSSNNIKSKGKYPIYSRVITTQSSSNGIKQCASKTGVYSSIASFALSFVPGIKAMTVSQIFGAVSLAVSNEQYTQAKTFKVTANARINDEADGRRLVITVDIDNCKNKEYKNVSYKLQLNKEVEPYIASGIITFDENDKMNVVPAEKAENMERENGVLVVTGFQHEWDMLLTTKEDLAEYWNLSPDGINNALKALSVKIIWDGGKQEESVPLSL